MSLAKQIGLVAAGCQPWNLDVCDACGDRFAYCATLAIYVYQVQSTTETVVDPAMGRPGAPPPSIDQKLGQVMAAQSSLPQIRGQIFI